MDRTETFVDFLLSASLREGVVRLEFGESMELPEDSKEEQNIKVENVETEPKTPELVPKHRLLMPVSGFVRSFRVMQEVMKRLEEEQKRQQSATGQQVAALPSKQTFVAESSAKQTPE